MSFSTAGGRTRSEAGYSCTTTRLDSNGRSANTKTVYTDKTHLALSSTGEEMAEVILKNKRDWWNRQQAWISLRRSRFPSERRNARCRELLGPSGERAIRLLLVTCGRTLHGRKSHH